MKHTPGPWEYFPKLSGSENHRGFRIGVNKGWLIADAMPIDMDGKEGEANARLISAAPDLLEALKDCLRVVEFLASDSCPTTIQNAKAAIAKATGEQQ